VPHDTTPELPPPKSCQSATASSIQFEGISVAIEQPQIGPGRLQRSLAKKPLPLARQNARASQMCCYSVTANKNPIRQTTCRLWKTAVLIAHRPFVDDDELSDSDLIRDAGIYKSRLRDLIHRSRL
jgi:hypothetical protein